MVNINSQRTSNAPNPAVKGNRETLFSGMVDKRQTMNDLTRMIQQGIHSGMDMVREPDMRVFDSLFTIRLNDRHIDARHQLIQLSIMPNAVAGIKCPSHPQVHCCGFHPSNQAKKL